ncbi:MAG TPA: nuclear transport factor 2 family protein [Vicinamibacterales bacterium]|jgi:hypothetical protein|nr:nuclear transport factor 2 family protein [Vicinamibacterales bacterium]
MKMPALVLMLAACAWTQGAAQAPQAMPIAPISYDAAVANEKELFAADQKHDMQAIASLVADEFVDIAKDGSVETKAGLLKEIPTLKLLSYSQNNFRVSVLGPYAYTISYDSDATVIDASGKQVRNQNALNSVWVKRDNRWQILLHSRGEARALDSR